METTVRHKMVEGPRELTPNPPRRKLDEPEAKLVPNGFGGALIPEERAEPEDPE